MTKLLLTTLNCFIYRKTLLVKTIFLEHLVFEFLALVVADLGVLIFTYF